LHFFGRGRINLSRHFKNELKLVHFFPAAFTLFCISIPLQFLIFKPLGFLSVFLLAIYKVLIFTDSTLKNSSIYVGFLSIIACFIQLSGYGFGFMQEIISPNPVIQNEGKTKGR
jgi:hypothetical protein